MASHPPVYTPSTLSVLGEPSVRPLTCESGEGAQVSCGLALSLAREKEAWPTGAGRYLPLVPTVADWRSVAISGDQWQSVAISGDHARG